MLRLFEVVFLQEYWLQDTWFIFNLAGSKSESSLLRSLLVGEKIFASWLKRSKVQLLGIGLSGGLCCYMPDRTHLWEGGDGDIFWSKEMTEPAVSQPLFWASVLLEIKVWDEAEQGILLLVKGMDTLIFPLLHTPLSLTRQESQQKMGQGGDVIIFQMTVQWGSGI